MIAALLLAVQVSTCGVHFVLPEGWTTLSHPVPPVRREKVVKCALAMQPARWVETNTQSPWPSEYPPAEVYVFEPGTSMDDAARVLGMVKNEDGQFMVSSRGGDAVAAPFRAGAWSGWHGGGWHRGYAEEAKKDKLAPEESSVYTGNHGEWLVRRGNTAVGLDCSDGTPAYHVDCEALSKVFFDSLN